jgi:hypothetical protein
MLKFLTLFIFVLVNSFICNSDELETETGSLFPDDFYTQNPPFYFLKTIPASVKLFSGIDLSFFRDKSEVNRYRYRLEIPVAGGTRIDRTLTRWSPWLKFDYNEVVIPILDLEGGYKFIIEYETSKTKELLRFERSFYVFRLIRDYSDEPVPQAVQPQTEKNPQLAASVSKPAPETPVPETNLKPLDEISRKTIRKKEVPVLTKLEIHPKEIDILKLVSDSTLYYAEIDINIGFDGKNKTQVLRIHPGSTLEVPSLRWIRA